MNNNVYNKHKKEYKFDQLKEIIIPKIHNKKSTTIFLRKNTFSTYISFPLFIIILLLYIHKSFQYKALSSKYNGLHNKILDYIFHPYHSHLISNINDLRLLKTWINQTTQLDHKGISFKMVYKATVHGDSAKVFHKNTDKDENYLIIIKDDNDNIFGGFTSKSFSFIKFYDFSWNINILDRSAFLFNLDEKIVYTINEECIENAIVADEECGPIFGEEGDLRIVDNFFSMESSCEFPNNYGKGIKEECAITKGRKRFKVVEMEVFKVYFDDVKN